MSFSVNHDGSYWRARKNALRHAQGNPGEIARALWTRYVERGFIPGDIFAGIYSVPPGEILTFTQLLTPELTSALTIMVGEEDFPAVVQLFKLKMKAPCFRSGGRSLRPGMYLDVFMQTAANWICWRGAEAPLLQVVQEDHFVERGLEEALLLAIHQEDPQIISALESCLTRENIRYQVLDAVLMSGHTRLTQLAGARLLLPNLNHFQWGLLMNSVNHGTVEAAACLLELIRSTPALRAQKPHSNLASWISPANGLVSGMDSWHQLLELAATALQHPDTETPAAEDPLHIYFALWGAASRDLHSAAALAAQYCASGNRTAILTAQIFAFQRLPETLSHEVALASIHERDPEIMAWAGSNLYENRDLLYMPFAPRKHSYPSPVFPDSNTEQARQFDAMERLLLAMGRKKPTFESFFPPVQIQLSTKPVFASMLSLIAHTPSAELIDRMAPHIKGAPANLRRVWYRQLLDPLQPSQLKHLAAGLEDKTGSNRQLVAQLLESIT